MEIETLIWCAGLYEGEGNIHLSTQRALMVTVVSTDKDLVEPFTMFGGNVGVRACKPKPNQRTVYQWRIGGNNLIKGFIDTILPYIRSGTKRAQLELALEYLAFDWAQKEQPRYMRDHARYNSYYQRFKELH